MSDAEEVPYSCTVEGGEPSTTSRGITGKCNIQYPNGDKFEGLIKNGVNPTSLTADPRRRRRLHLQRRIGLHRQIQGQREGRHRKDEVHRQRRVPRFAHIRVFSFLGEFCNGKRHGDGLFTYSNKDIYSGQWKNGKKHGNGTYIFAKQGGDMKVGFYASLTFQLKGCWDEGNLQTGKWIMFNGDFYQGEFSNNKPNGAGQWQMHNGNVITGKYTQEMLPKDEQLDVEE